MTTNDPTAEWPPIHAERPTWNDLMARLRTTAEALRAFAVSGIEHETRMYGLMQVDRNDLERARAILAQLEQEGLT